MVYVLFLFLFKLQLLLLCYIKDKLNAFIHKFLTGILSFQINLLKKSFKFAPNL